MIALGLLLLASASGSSASSVIVPASLSLPTRLVTAPDQLVVETTPTLSTPVRATPAGDPSRWVNGADRPTGDSAKGTIRIRLSLARDGTPISCAVLQGLSDAIDAATCRAMIARARFQPLAAGDRRPIRLYSEHTILWGTAGAQMDRVPL